MHLNKNQFDAALQAGIREAIAPTNSQLRAAESVAFARLLDKEGDFLPGASFTRDCPLCNHQSTKAEPLIRAHGMQLVRCQHCSMVYSREILDPRYERQRYHTSEASDANLALKMNPAYAALEASKAAYVLGRLSQHTDGGRLLDIGSSSGTLLRIAKAADWDVYGVELCTNAANQSKLTGLNVICGEYPDDMPADWPNFEAITALDVLEHIPNPLVFLAAIRSHLSADGWLAIQVPNFESLLLTIEGAGNNNICHGHWSYFNAHALRNTLEKAGFKTIFLETYISELDRIQAYPEGIIMKAWQALSRTPLDSPKNLTVERLHHEMMGYKLFGLFQKTGP